MLKSVPIPSFFVTKHLFFDLDDTLWATYVNNKNSLKELFERERWNQFYASFEEFFAIYDPINVSLWKQFRQGLVDKQTLIVERLRKPLQSFLGDDPALYKQLNVEFLKITGRQPLLEPHALETIKQLSKHYQLSIISNGFTEVQYQKLQNTGLLPHFHQVILSDQVKVAKPHPTIYKRALSSARVKASQSVMIGDCWEADMIGAMQVKMPTIWYNPQKLPLPPEETPGQFRHVVQITSLPELLQIF